MHAIIRSFLLPALCVGLGSLLFAQDSGTARTEGKVLLLKNGGVEEGDIVRRGERICIRRGKSEVWIDANRALLICIDWDDAYRQMQTHVQLDNADERVRFARWCSLHGLKDRALEQARAAVEISPNHQDAKLIVSLLENATPPSTAKPNAPAAPTVAAAPAAPTFDVTTETLINFSTHVQPILMNKCASCHAGGGKFRLDRVSSAGHQVVTRNNLQSVLAWIDVDKPGQSPLLTKAIEVHGGDVFAPLKNRSVVPYLIMQAWIEQTVKSNPSLHAKRDPRTRTAPGTSAFGADLASAKPASGGVPTPAKASIDPIQQTQVQQAYLNSMIRKQPVTPAVQQALDRVAQVGPASSAVKETPGGDPFDPTVFNQANHPHGPSWQPPARTDVSASR